MALYVNTNVSSINSQNKLNNATNSLNTTYQRLASGLRINSAKDDSAGLQISNRMTAQINGLNQGNRNANDGIALAQTAEGAMDEMTTMLQKIRTLALQSANGTNTSADRAAIQKDVKAFSEEITRISEKTTFNGQTLLSGKDGNNTLLINGKINFQVGSNANDILDVDLSKGFSVKSIVNDSFGSDSVSTEVTLTSVDGTTGTGALAAGTYINLKTGDKVEIDGTTDVKTAYGDVILQSADDPTKMFIDKDSAAALFDATNGTAGTVAGQALGTAGNAATIDADKMMDLIRGTEITGASVDLVNQLSSGAFGLSIDRETAGNATAGAAYAGEFTGNVTLNASTYLSSQSLLEMSDSLIAYVDGKRADLGAIQNRMESTIRNQSNIMENTTDARSRIRDTDFAAETANLTQQSIIQQAASSMLMQANQRPQMALSLLG